MFTPGLANLVVSLVSIHKGQWQGRRLLDNQTVPMINAFFEDSAEGGEPKTLLDNASRIFQGSIFLGDGFLLTHDEARRLIATDAKNQEVIYPVTNGKEINNEPTQSPGRSIINFFDWPIEKAREYELPFQIVERFVKPEREKSNRAIRRDRWWQYAERATSLYSKIILLKRCFVTARVTKYLNFSALPTNYIYLNNLYALTSDRWDLQHILSISYL